MKAREVFREQQKCSVCDAHREGYFCDFTGQAMGDFEAIKVTRMYPKGSMMFAQGQPANGVYIVCQGRAKLSIYSQDGKTVILRVVQPGDVLGLSATMSDRTHHATAQAVEGCQVNFVSKAAFNNFLKTNPVAALRTIEQLNKNYERACVQIRSLALSNSAGEKLARLFLSWTRRNGNGHSTCELRLGFTHEEIGSMIGASRETVTRLLKEFKRRGLIEVNGPNVTICDAHRLEAMTDEKSNGAELAE
jgi:CRP/FNR family transcriptional regulator